MGINPPFLVIKEGDKAGVLVIVIAFSLSTLLNSFALRVCSKYRVWKADDWCILLATVGIEYVHKSNFGLMSSQIISTARTCILFWQVSAGLGKSKVILSHDAQDTLQKVIKIHSVIVPYTDWTGHLRHLLLLLLHNDVHQAIRSIPDSILGRP